MPRNVFYKNDFSYYSVICFYSYTGYFKRSVCIFEVKLPDICLTGEGKPRKKNLPRKLVPTGDRIRARCVHAAAWPTAVDSKDQLQCLRMIEEVQKNFYVPKILSRPGIEPVPAA